MKKQSLYHISFAFLAFLLILPNTIFANQLTIASFVFGHSDIGANKVLGVDITQNLSRTPQYRASPHFDAFWNAAENMRLRVEQQGQQLSDRHINEIARDHGVARVCVVHVTPVLGSFFIRARIIDIETGMTISNTEIDNSLASVNDIRTASAQLVGAMVGAVPQPQRQAPATVSAPPPQQMPTQQVQTPMPVAQQPAPVATQMPAQMPTPIVTHTPTQTPTPVVTHTQTQTQTQAPTPMPVVSQPTSPHGFESDAQVSIGGGGGGGTRVGIKAALNLSRASVRMYNRDYNTAFGAGFETGFVLNTSLSRHWSFVYGVDLIFRSPVSDNPHIEVSETAVAVPALFRLSTGGDFGAFIESGFQLDITGTGSKGFERNTPDFGYVIGYGLSLGRHVDISNQWNFGMRDFIPVQDAKVIQNSTNLIILF